jgi:hypothetical protein
MEHERRLRRPAQHSPRRQLRHVPVGAREREHVLARELVDQRAAELAAGPG